MIAKGFSNFFFFFLGATQGFIKLWLDGVVLLLEDFHGLGSIRWVIRDWYWLGTFCLPLVRGSRDRGSQHKHFQSIFCQYIYIYILPPFTLYIYTHTHTHTNTIWCINVSFYFFLISTNTILFFYFFISTNIYIYIYI